MIKSEYAIAYKEVFEILKYIPKEDYNKIPSEKIELYKVMQEKNYNFKYNPSKTLDEQNVSKRAKAIIALLFRDYWATDIQRKKILEKQKYDRQRIEEEKKQKYQYKDLFKKEERTIEIKDNTDSVTLIKYKENVFNRFLNRIRIILKRLK